VGYGVNAPTWQVPDNVAAGVAERWPEIGPRWITAAPAELAKLCAEYDAKPSHVFAARYALVVAAETRTGSQLVFRSSPDPTAAHHAAVSQALAHEGRGPAVHQVITADIGTWTIADRVVPGDPLPTLTLTPDALAAVVTLFHGLVDRPAPPGLPTLGAWLRDRLEDDNLTDVAPFRPPITPTERRQALALLDDLVSTGNVGLCHGDMSGANILLGPDGQLLLIDPRGVAGDAAYDAAVLATKASNYGIPDGTIPRLIKESGIDESRTEAWGVVAIAARV